MITFDVQDMTCGHCAATITRTLQAIDPDAQVQIDLTTKRVVIDSPRIDAEQGRVALAEAGYTAVPR